MQGMRKLYRPVCTHNSNSQTSLHRPYVNWHDYITLLAILQLRRGLRDGLSGKLAAIQNDMILYAHSLPHHNSTTFAIFLQNPFY